MKTLAAISFSLCLLGCSKPVVIERHSSGVGSTAAGVELPWERIGTLQITSGRVWAGDPALIPEFEHGQIVTLPNGSYLASMKKVDFSGDVRVSRLRLSSQENPDLGKVLGETFADSGMQGVCDFEEFKKAVPRDPEEYWRRFEKAFTKEEIGTLSLGRSAELLFTPSGFGDGTFTLYELISGGKRCGVEIEMIKPGETSPFAMSNP